MASDNVPSPDNVFGINDETIDSPIYGLYEQAADGFWNPRELDYSQDIEDWEQLTDRQREILLRITTNFMAGEQRVAEEIAPLVYAAHRLGNFHWVSHLCMFLMEEFKHAEFFVQWHKNVVGHLDAEEMFQYVRHKTWDPDGEYEPGVIGVKELPQSMEDLLDATLHGDREDVERAYVRAATIYNVHQEGISGQPSYRVALDTCEQFGDVLPALQQGYDHILQDEGRHVIGGVRIIRELLEKNPEYEQIVYDLFDEHPANLVGLVGFQNANPDLDGYQYKELQAQMYEKRFKELGLETDDELLDQILDEDIRFETKFLKPESPA
jgi:ribonucleoside-diphosphate reductase beta chain